MTLLCSGYTNGFLLTGEYKNETSTIPACVDVDECATNPCIAPKGQCTNSPGGHSCGCDAGYYEDSEGNCLDYDECSNDAHDCNGAYAKCTNLSPAINPKGKSFIKLFNGQDQPSGQNLFQLCFARLNQQRVLIFF